MDSKYLALALLAGIFLFVFIVDNSSTGEFSREFRYKNIVDMRLLDYSLTGSCYAEYLLQPKTHFPLFHMYYYCENLPPTKGNDMYHVWLINTELDEYLDLGGFKILPQGIGQLDFTSTNIEIKFDKIMMTLEKYPDDSINPSKPLMISEV
ncbi:hypothetical protein JW851_01055 [Candidatus Woesearchaeota archaeon]|nr:hypothetical protein [Candidatus Woesearchaeota archaeon]